MPAVTLPVIVYLALLVSPWERIEMLSGSSRRFFGWPLRACGIVVAVLVVIVVLPLYVADYYLERS
jgi:hypothetical protein